MNVIIIAVLALIVLVVLASMLVSKTAIFSKGDSCEANNGVCSSDIGKDCPDGYAKWSFKQCADEKKQCCFLR